MTDKPPSQFQIFLDTFLYLPLDVISEILLKILLAWVSLLVAVVFAIASFVFLIWTLITQK